MLVGLIVVAGIAVTWRIHAHLRGERVDLVAETVPLDER